jgi:N-acetyl-gamma-glutamyl-phosphate reductase
VTPSIQAAPAPPAAEPAAAALRVAVLGAGGYTGQELARLARRHPALQVAALAVREPAAAAAEGPWVGRDPRSPAPPLVSIAGLESLLAAGELDALAVCLPHGAWARLLAERPALGACARRVVDLSSDHRGGEGDYVYGLPEAFRARIAGSARVANPGCYATAIALALLPAAEAGWLAGPAAVSAVSGASGAGRASALRTSFVEAEGGAWLYRAGKEHAHVAEVERALGQAAGRALEVALAPQVAPMSRGILAVAYAPLAAPLAPADARRHYEARCREEPFVRVLPHGAWPETRAVARSNRCDVAVTTVHGGRTLLAAAALDNLVKGAAGQAIQNLNLMCGWPEALGLPLDGQPW